MDLTIEGLVELTGKELLSTNGGAPRKARGKAKIKKQAKANPTPFVTVAPECVVPCCPS
jgi:hypothetical protein